VRSQHLYQLITYLQHERARNESKGLSGMLIYPAVGQSLRLRYRLLDIPVLVVTIDIGREWQDIEVELHGLVDECAGAAGRELAPQEAIISSMRFDDLGV
jgi:5-methylcytosine-specific restriction enzyme subunit McrC